MRLKNQLILNMTIYIAIPFLIFASIAIYLVYQSSIHSEQEHFKKSISNITIEMSNYLERIESSLDLFLLTSDFYSKPVEERDKLLNIYYQQIKNDIKRIYVTDKNGKIVFLYPENTNYKSFSFSNQPWFSNMHIHQTSHISSLYFSEIDDKYSSFIAKPILSKNKDFSGMIGIELNFEKANNIVSNKGYNYIFYLVDSQNNIITDNSKIDNPSFLDDLNPNENVDIKEIIYDNQNFYLTSSKLENYPYNLVALVSSEEFLESTRSLQIQFVIWLVFSIISVLFVGFLADRSIILPIEKLVHLTKKISHQKSLSAFNETVIINNKGELSELNEHFTQMIHHLQARDESLYQLRIDLIQIMAELLELNDPYTGGHSYRVYRYSSLIARQMKLGIEHIRDIETAAILHDIGKIGIPDEILNKKGNLTNQEYEIIKNHSKIGERVLIKVKDFHTVRNAILYHHERFDGKGYPDMLTGENIPIEARIISVADAFDAMTTNRPYRLGMTLEQAKNIILEESGKQFDPDIVEAFQHLYFEQYFALTDIHKQQNFSNWNSVAN